VRAVVDERDDRSGDLVADAPRKQGAALLDGLGRERRAEHAEERGRYERVEHHGRLHGGRFGGPEELHGTLGRLGAAVLRIEVGRRPCHGERQARLDLVVLFGQHVGEGVAVALAV